MGKLSMILVLALSISACSHDGSDGATGATGPQGPAAPAPVVTPAQQHIDDVIASENAYREGLGETELSVGLSCTVQAISAGQYLSSSSPGYTAAQAIVLTGPSYAYLLTVGFDQPNSNPGPNNVIDPSIQPLFLNNNYRIVCSGQMVVNDDGYHSFSMSSDDGAILTVDGTQVINNDGNHGITTMSGTKNLRKDVVHTFSLQYAQSGAGQFALILNMDGVLLPPANLYH
jgi:hypothetical protein